MIFSADKAVQKANVEATVTPFFGSLRDLPKQAAIRVRRIIMGLKLLHEDKVDLAPLSAPQIVKKAEKIGQVPNISEA